ncbi:MAG: TetR/AcrR family transcriptional regulator C-terminal domain-containing protein [Clostridia bacterium]|nr:TetR/AcrR family transcriptional regulator C-terminal domain-containing protein [Clostridia bacterium]
MNQRVALTKRLIKENLLKLLREKDVTRVTVKELCSASGINRSTFYDHYGSPRDVLKDIERDEFMSMGLTRCRTKEEIRSELIRMCRLLYDHRETQCILFRNNSDDEVAQTFSDPIFSAFVPAAFLGDLGKRDPADLALCSTFLCFGLYHVLKEWLLSGADKTPDEIGDLMADIILK